MSCPTQNLPLKARLDALDGDVELPRSFYVLTIMMIALGIGLPLLYRILWLVVFDIIFDIKEIISLPKPPEGCRRYGQLAMRNLSKETFAAVKDNQYPRHDEFPSLENGEMSSSAASPKFKDARLTGRIEALNIHPIKSTHAIGVESAAVTPLGFAYDRLFSFAQMTKSIPDPQTGKPSSLWVFLSQRSHPRLQMVKTEIWIPDPSDPDYDEEGEWVKNGGCIVGRFPYADDVDISYKGMLSLLSLLICKVRARSLNAEPLVEFRIPICPTAERAKEKNYPVERMKIWRETPESWNMSSEIPEEIIVKLKRFLGVSNQFTIFRIQPGFERELYKCSPSAEKLGYQPVVGFQDGYPLHIQTVSSIQAVESAILNPKSAQSDPTYIPDSRRFRANIYISGPDPFVEVDMKRMAVQGRPETNDQASEPMFFSLPARCPRCVLPNNNPSTGTRPKRAFPLKYLKTEWMIDKGADSPVLGMNAVPWGQAIGRSVRVGDEVIIYRPGEHFYNPNVAKEDQTEVW